MPRRTRLFLLTFGVLILFCSLAVLAYASWSVETATLHATLQPTVFTPP